MTNFQRDLIRYLETTSGPDYEKLAEQFFFHETYEHEGKPWVWEHWETGELTDDTPEGWDNMNISYEFVSDYGGEGQGSDYWTVYKFTDNATGEEVFIKFDGWYQSYNGAEYESCFVVQPKEKTVVVYE